MKDTTNNSKAISVKKDKAVAAAPPSVVVAPTAGLTADQIRATKAAAQQRAQARASFVSQTVVIEYQQAMGEQMGKVADAFDQIDQFYFSALVGCAEEAYAPQQQISAAPTVNALAAGE